MAKIGEEMSARIVSSLLACSILVGSLCAQDKAPDPSLAANRVVVIRFHGRLFEQLLEQEVQRSVPVRTCVLDAWCVGTADVTAETSLDFADGTIDRIPIKLTGVIDARANGYVGQIMSSARTRMSFRGDLAVGFDGDHFYPLPSLVHACSRSTVDRVSTRRKGIGSRLVSCIGPRLAPHLAPKYDAAGARLAERQIIEEVDKTIGQQVSPLNEILDLEKKTLVALAATQGYQRKISKTNTYLQVRAAPVGQPEPVPPDATPDAPVEIWIYPNADRPPPANIAMMWKRVPQQLRQMLKLPEPLAKLDQEVQLSEVGDWDVIRAGRFADAK